MNGKTVLSGDLEYLNLGELIQLIGSNGSTGILRLISKYIETPGQIYFKDGNPVEARAETSTGMEALFKLFGWTEGIFEFSNDPVTVKRSINKSRMEIILEGLRLLDDKEIEIKGAVTFDTGENNSSQRGGLPLIRGPMIDYMDVVAEEEYPAGHPIVHQGRHGTWMWVILEGEVEICKEAGEQTTKILRAGPGSFIGSMSSFNQQGDVRSATVVTSDRVQLGVLDRQRLTQEYVSLSMDFRNLMLNLDKRLKLVTLLTTTSPDKEKKKAVRISGGKTPVIKQGGKSERLFAITQGNAYVINESPGHDLILAKLGKGDFFGKIPSINIGHEPESAAVYGSDDIKLRAVDVEALAEEYERLSGTMANMIDNCANFIAATTSIVLTSHQKK